MSQDAIAQTCVDDLLTKLRGVQQIASKKWGVVDEDDLFNKSVTLTYPCVGVVYEGIRGAESAEKAGKTSEIVFSMYLLYKLGSIGKVDYKPAAIKMLDTIRKLLVDSPSPTGHKWRFRFESPAEDIHGALVYYQRWSAVVIV